VRVIWHRFCGVEISAKSFGGYAATNIDEFVLYHGRRYVLRGLDPAGVVPRYAYLKDVGSGEVRQVPFEEVKPDDQRANGASHLRHTHDDS
jgi:hypothetical protein